ncbi:carbonic anhydrase 12-like [Strongylocentrotus purpuratus]|uniref:Carbonic anhydrase n=2 Tax=Strongylocentrotus purpuratus TaxID=7668 RepID=A0A7M7PJA3_STRPU|nr:carbonic anhydrase 12-like [Strongylocentrotus purpuratus]|eukprot:XP_011667172.1 PREDICTED: carbonic anhydrase 12 [Strongylocentrotus purpuratus]
MFPYQCAGSMQSPIAIQTINTKRKEWAPLELNGYGDTDGKRMTLTNLGTTVELMLEGNYTIRGGGLGGTYVADQVHFHWGFSNEQGSEHVLDRRKYPAEMHIVHHEQSLIGDSIFHTPGGVAAIGVFIEIGEKNEAFEKLVKHLKEIKFKDESQLVTEPIRLTELFPKNRSQFYRYIGSLTTPPCYEVVTWTVLKQPITISREQMSALRGVFETTRHAYVYRTETPILLQNNFRPAQSINGRDVYRCGF